MIENVILTATVLLQLCSDAGVNPTPSRPIEGTWKLWNSPKLVPQEFTLTSLADGRVLMAGGEGGPSGASTPAEHAAELLDPRNGIWRLTDRLPGFRVQHTVVALASGGVLRASGLDHRTMEWPHFGRRRRWAPPPLSRAMLVSAETWEPGRGWRATGALSDARVRAPGVLLSDRRVMVAGGVQATFGPSYIRGGLFEYGNDNYLGSVEIWSPHTGRWQLASPMLQKRHGHTMTALADGRVLAVGGAPGVMVDGGLPIPAEVWDPATGRWTATTRTRWDRLYHTATRLRDGRVLVTGGRTPVEYRKQVPGTRLNTAEVWDPKLNVWTEAAPMAYIRFQHQAILLPDGRVMVVGGFFEGTRSAEIWNPATDSWTPTGPFAGRYDGNGGQLAALPEGKVLLVSRSTVQVWSPSSPKE